MTLRSRLRIRLGSFARQLSDWLDPYENRLRAARASQEGHTSGFQEGRLSVPEPRIVRDWLDMGLVPVTADQVNPYRVYDGVKRSDDFRTEAARKAYWAADGKPEPGLKTETKLLQKIYPAWNPRLDPEGPAEVTWDPKNINRLRTKLDIACGPHNTDNAGIVNPEALKPSKKSKRARRKK